MEGRVQESIVEEMKEKQNENNSYEFPPTPSSILPAPVLVWPRLPC